MANAVGVQPAAGVRSLVAAAAAEGKMLGFVSTHATSLRISTSPLATRPRRGFDKRATISPFSAAPWAMRCALEMPPPPPEAPQPTRTSMMVEVVKKVCAEIQKDIFLWLLIIFSLLIGVLAMKGNPKAVVLVTVCEKDEKIHKFVSHFGPLLAGIAACFR